MDACEPNISECTHATKKGRKALKGASREALPELSLSEDMLTMSLMEREQEAIADIARIELEVRVLQLEEKGACLLLSK